MQPVGLNLIQTRCVVVVFATVVAVPTVHFDSNGNAITNLKKLFVVVHRFGSVVTDFDNRPNDFVSADVWEDRFAA